MAQQELDGLGRGRGGGEVERRLALLVDGVERAVGRARMSHDLWQRFERPLRLLVRPGAAQNLPCLWLTAAAARPARVEPRPQTLAGFARFVGRLGGFELDMDWGVTAAVAAGILGELGQRTGQVAVVVAW